MVLGKGVFRILVTLLMLFGDVVPVLEPSGLRTLLLDDDGTEATLIPDTPPNNLCLTSLPSQEAGLLTLLEDCRNMDKFGTNPPTEITLFQGISPLICCPVDSPTIFKTEYESLVNSSASYEEYEYFSDYDSSKSYLYYDENGGITCEEGTSCVAATRCDFSDSDVPPRICGWDRQSGEDKVCCSVRMRRKSTNAPAKYGNEECRDFHGHCRKIISGDPKSCNVNSESYGFMRVSCMETCGRCGDKGCLDEFEECEKWARAGHCARYSPFMVFNCRESCGTCGFRSASNSKAQVKNGKDYSNLSSDAFFCGEYKRKQFSLERKRKRREANSKKPKLFAYSSEEEASPRGINCGSVLINDMFIVSAAHCEMQFVSGEKKIRSIIIRDGSKYEEQIEIKRTFIHPLFKFPQLYYDISVSQLGRRIIYDFDTIGDSPTCLAKKAVVLDGKTAILQGYGYTEEGFLSNALLQTNVTIISNRECASYLMSNASSNLILRARLNNALRNGINDQLMCSTGHYNEDAGVWSGPCEGDSGGPLYLLDSAKNNRIRSTLVGIISGGMGCGVNMPSWYTRVSKFQSWIQCIVIYTRKGYTKMTIENVCKRFISVDESKNTIAI